MRTDPRAHTAGSAKDSFYSSGAKLELGFTTHWVGSPIKHVVVEGSETLLPRREGRRTPRARARKHRWCPTRPDRAAARFPEYDPKKGELVIRENSSTADSVTNWSPWLPSLMFVYIYIGTV